MAAATRTDETPSERPGFLAAARAFGVVLGGPIVLAAAAAASTVSLTRALAEGRKPAALALAGSAALAAYVVKGRPWVRQWGATHADRALGLPGDELVPEPGVVTTRAVTIDAPIEVVWMWLAQIGQDRGGFYSYEWLENLAGCQMHNADRIHPEWQGRDVGETVMLHPASGLRVLRFEPPRVFSLENWGTFVLEPVGGTQTRLLVRGRSKAGLASIAYSILLELPHFVMERRMLLGIKRRAERTAAPVEED